MKMRSRGFFIIAIIMGGCLWFSSIGNCADLVKIGVLANRGPVKCLEKWQATADYLTEKVEGLDFEIVPLAFDAVNPTIEKGEIDFFLVNSSMYITAQVKYDTAPVLTLINSRNEKALKSFGGVIFVSAKNKGISSLEDIKGKTIMGVKMSSFGGWQMAYKELIDAGIDPFKDATVSFGESHDNVVLAVQNEEVEVGTVRTDTLERMAAEGTVDMEDFIIINPQEHEDFPFVVSTALYPEWPLGKVSATADDVVKKVSDALKGLTPYDAASKAAKIIGWVDPLDYSGVEALQQSLKIGAYAE
jgi:ABC-type phosphate/phosphonate transport system substrate-binding protein